METLPAVPVPPDGMEPAASVMFPPLVPAVVEDVSPALIEISPAAAEDDEEPAESVMPPAFDEAPPEFPAVRVTVPPPTEVVPTAAVTATPFPVEVDPLVDPLRVRAEVVLFVEKFVMVWASSVPLTTRSPPKTEAP